MPRKSPAASKRGFGQVSQMRSGRYQARYTGPDGALHTAPSTFEHREAAQFWLAEPSGTVGSKTRVRNSSFQSRYCTTIIRLIMEMSGIDGTLIASWKAY